MDTHIGDLLRDISATHEDPERGSASSLRKGIR
jgi:hypothetical protein